MAFRLSEHIVSGEIFNTKNYSVHGWLELRGREQPLVLQLTGNCSPDLAGWHFRFEARPSPNEGRTDDDWDDLDVLATQQIGPTGTMTVAGHVRPAGSAPTESDVHGRLEEPQPNEPGQCLYLEWFSQNGRVLIELPNPVLEFVEYQPLRGESPPGDMMPNAGCGESAPARPSRPSEEAASAEADEDAEPDEEESPEDNESDDEKDADPYQLFPRDLQLQFDLEAKETDWNLQDDEDKPQMLREMELMDDLIENSPGVPLNELFDGPLKCPLPDQLGDQEVEEALKKLLAQLALYGVAVDVCEHFSPREVYRLLLDQICTEERAYPELRNTQWVQHYSMSDYCEQCQAEMDREFDEQQDGEWPGPEDADDEMEF